MSDIADIASLALQSRERELHDEQGVYGLDSLDELDLHPLFAAALFAGGFGALREQPYPHEWTTRRRATLLHTPTLDIDAEAAPSSPVLVKVSSTDAFPESRPGTLESARLPLPRERLRCDLVITRQQGEVLGDPVVQERARRARAQELAGTLFESHPPTPEPVEAQPGHVAPEDALWIEVKSLAQFDLSSGVPGFNRSYASSLVRAMGGDLRKLTDDARIHAGASLLVLFTHDQATADHDLSLALHKCLDRGLSLAHPEIRRFAIDDRLGNAVCTLCLTPMKR